MPKRSSKKIAPDLNEIAARVARVSTGEPEPTTPRRKNPHAVALGRKGGLKGGKARAKSLSKERRQAIAKAAALARWRDGGK
jgi:hypothetical protein